MSKAPRRGRWQFSLRTMFVLVTILGVWLGLRVNSARQQRLAVERLNSQRGHVWYDFEINDEFENDPFASPGEPAWLTRLVGVDFFHRPVAASLTVQGDEQLPLLAVFGRLRVIWFGECPITADGLRELRGLDELEELSFWQCRQIDDAAVEELAIHHPRLRKLHLQSTIVTDAAVDSLRALPELTYVNLIGTRLSQAAVDGLRQAGLLVAFP